ncbi:MAG: hypothetical protein ACI9G1_001062 [Pirellulaceae bacterium]|jgi:hypothetical protein
MIRQVKSPSWTANLLGRNKRSIPVRGLRILVVACSFICVPALSLSAKSPAAAAGQALHGVAEYPVSTVSGAADAANLATSLKGKFVPTSEARVNTTRAALKTAIGKLERNLNRARKPWGAGWREYLLWDDMQKELSSDKPNLQVLNKVRQRYYQNQNGLEIATFTGVRSKLTDYMNAVLFSNPKAATAYDRQLDSLAAQLAAHEASPNNDSALEIGRSIGWLERARQAKELQKAVRSRYSNSNFYAQISAELIADAAHQPVDQTMAVRENILGTSINGTAHMYGELNARLVPNSSRATIDLLLSGTTISNNVGVNGPVTIYTVGNTSVQSSKRVWLTAGGIISAAATACCSTSTEVTGVCAKRKIIEKIAWRKIGSSKSEAESVASQRAEVRVSQSMDKKSSTTLADANGRYADKVRKPLTRRGGFPQGVSTSSDSSFAYIEVLQASKAQIAAPSAPPVVAGSPELSVRLHETSIANFSQSILGGFKLTDEKLESMLVDMSADIPEALKTGPDSDPWSITFDNDAPFLATFSDQKLTIALRGRQFSRGDQEIPDSMSISATYDVAIANGGVKLTRNGDVRVDYLKSKSLSVTQVAFKTFLKVKFEAMFKEEFVSNGLVLPGKLESLGTIPLSQIDSQKGWLSLGWKRQADVVMTAQVR